MSVINLSDRRQPVAYTVRITHHWDDSIEVLVEDVADDERSRQSVADALARAANAFGNRTAPMPEEIDQLTRERDEARAALKPFAALFLWPDDVGDEWTVNSIRSDEDWSDEKNDAQLDDKWVRRGDIRSARKALEDKP